MPKQILLIEDEQDIADLLTLNLRDLDLETTHSADGVHGLALALQHDWDLVLLDLSLPRCDGLDICEQVRTHNPAVPIILVTARTSESERINGLESGADDYITKPFSVAELLARVKAVLRRAELCKPDLPGQPVVAVKDLLLNIAERSVTINGKDISLTAKEFDLLLYFAQSPGRVFNRTELLHNVWGYRFNGYMHTVNSHINRLRSKIEPDPTNPQYIATVWGVGYKMLSPST